MKKFGAVIAALACVSAFSAAASAETDLTGLGKTPIELPDSVKEQLADNGSSSTDTAKSDGETSVASDKDAADTGVESVAAGVGAIVLAGAAVVLSKKRN